MGELKKQIANLSERLNNLIAENGYELNAFEVIQCSQELDKLMAKYQKQLIYGLPQVYRGPSIHIF